MTYASIKYKYDKERRGQTIKLSGKIVQNLKLCNFLMKINCTQFLEKLEISRKQLYFKLWEATWDKQYYEKSKE
jgi:hypothetical protein